MKRSLRYRLRTLLIVLAIGPLVLAGAWLLFAAIQAELRASFLSKGIGS